MHYSQSKKYRSLIEALFIIALLSVYDYYSPIQMTSLHPGPLLFIIMFFSLKYGWKIGILLFFSALAYVSAEHYIQQRDLLLLFIDYGQFKWILLYLTTAIACGFYSTTTREKYQDLLYEIEEVKSF